MAKKDIEIQPGFDPGSSEKSKPKSISLRTELCLWTYTIYPLLQIMPELQ